MKFAPTLRLCHGSLCRLRNSVNARRETHKEAPKETFSSTLPHAHLDYKSILDNVAYKTQNAINRKASLPEDGVISAAALYAKLKSLNSDLGHKLSLRNILSERVREKSDPERRKTVVEEAQQLKSSIAVAKAQIVELEGELLKIALRIPNDTHPDVPIGPESSATVLSSRGPELLPVSELRDHLHVARALGILELDAAAITTGSSWYYLLNEGALLEIALTNYALSVAMKHGYRPVITPDVVRADIASRCGFQPRDTAANMNQMYHLAHDSTKNHPQLVLSGTAEIPLAGMFSGKLYEEADLPLKVVGVGRAFRAEAGARGTDTRGLYRVHQFTKVELFAVTAEASSSEMLEDMKNIQEEILNGLHIPVRILDMPSEELGASAYRKYDIEAWMPGRGKWGEVTSASNCTDYQARRLHIRYRPRKTVSQDLPEKKLPLPYAHTLNGTAAAIPRLIIALLENGARLEGDNVVGVNLPNVLRPFWLGQGSIGQKEIFWV